MIVAGILFGLVWGSFLNVVACRLICSESLRGRSRCTQCCSPLAWYDLIPVISWFLLRARCRNCAASISWLYPFIELLTALVFGLLITKMPMRWWFSYALLSSALLVTVRTDLEFLLVSRYASIFLVPVGIVFAYGGLLPISGVASILGAMSAYAFLYCVAWGFQRLTGKEGMGQGDFELLSCVGAFIGFPGWWFVLLYASVIGSCVGLLYALFRGSSSMIRLPFCPFIAFGTWLYLFWPEYTAYFLAGYGA